MTKDENLNGRDEVQKWIKKEIIEIFSSGELEIEVGSRKWL